MKPMTVRTVVENSKGWMTGDGEETSADVLFCPREGWATRCAEVDQLNGPNNSNETSRPQRSHPGFFFFHLFDLSQYFG